MNNSRIINPASPEFGVHYRPGPLVAHHAFNMQHDAGMSAVIFSGETQLLKVATQLMCAQMSNHTNIASHDSPDPIEACLDIAERLIEGSNKRLSKSKSQTKEVDPG